MQGTQSCSTLKSACGMVDTHSIITFKHWLAKLSMASEPPRRTTSSMSTLPMPHEAPMLTRHWATGGWRPNTNTKLSREIFSVGRMIDDEEGDDEEEEPS